MKNKVTVMKPSFKVGDQVMVNFLGSKLEAEIIEVKTHPQYPDKGIYTVFAHQTGKYIPYVGENGSEAYANIVTETKKPKAKKTEEIVEEKIPEITPEKPEENSGSFENFFEYK
jgi:hypothetical protein